MPGGNKNIKPSDGRQFSKTNQPANRGRPVKVFSAIAREYQARGIEKATDAVVKEAFELLLSLPISEVLELAGNPKVENDYPALLRLMAKELMGKNGLAAIREMLDRAHGRAKQAVEHSGKDGNPMQFQNVSDAALDKALSILENDGK